MVGLFKSLTYHYTTKVSFVSHRGGREGGREGGRGGGGGVEQPLLLLLEANARFDVIMVDVIDGGIIVNSPTY